MRLSLAEEFSTIHVLNLRGNQRTAGELSRKEGGKVFGGGSRATVAVTVLVKNPAVTGPATLHYTDIGDYLSREEKLETVAEAKTLSGLESATLQPNVHGDWLTLRADDYPLFTALVANDGVLRMSGLGVGTARDAYVYGSSRSVLARQVQRHIEFYTEHLGADEPPVDLSRGSWGGDIRKHLSRGRQVAFDKGSVRSAMYRPFMRQWRYLDPVLNNRVGVANAALPMEASENLGFYVLNPGADKPWSALMVPAMPDLAFFGSNAGHLMLRWTWEPVAEDGTLDLGGDSDGEVVDGYRRIDNVTDEALRRWQAAYGEEWTGDDVFFYVYGLLHSPDYRERYAADLKKMLPRIPLVATAADARAFADAGRALSDLHIGYESVRPYPLDGLDVEPAGDPYDFFSVGAKMRFGRPSAEQKAAGERADRSVIHYNDRITLSGIPDEAYRYQLGSRSGVEWIVDRYWVKTDKASGIVNDPNDWSREVGDPRYIIDLLARVVTVSVETMKIVDGLPPLSISGQQGKAAAR